MEQRMLAPARPRNKDDKKQLVNVNMETGPGPMASGDDESLLFTAFQPALSSGTGTNSTVYGCAGTIEVNEAHGVIAIATEKGDYAWSTVLGSGVMNLGACSGITSDMIFAPADASESGDAVYLARGARIQALDSESGKLLWTYTPSSGSGGGGSGFVVVDKDSFIVASGGGIAMAGMKEVLPPTPSQTPTIEAPNMPTKPPSSRTPRPTPAPFNMVQTEPPTEATDPSGATTRGISYYGIALLAGLPLLLALLR